MRQISPSWDDDKVFPLGFADGESRANLRTASANPNNFEYIARPRFPVVAEVLLASSWLLAIGLLNIFYAISVIADSTIFITTASWLVGDARPWGWLMLAVGLVQLMAVPGVLMGRLWALWVGLISVAGHVAALIMFIADAPGVAIALLGFDLIVAVCLLSVVRSARSTAG